MSDRLEQLTAAMGGALREVAPTDERDWNAIKVVTVELEVSPAGTVTSARGWLEKRVNVNRLLGVRG